MGSKAATASACRFIEDVTHPRTSATGHVRPIHPVADRLPRRPEDGLASAIACRQPLPLRQQLPQKATRMTRESRQPHFGGGRANVRIGSIAPFRARSQLERFYPNERTCSGAISSFESCHQVRLARLFDHGVGATKQWQRHGNAKLLGGPKVYHELDLYRLLNR